MNRPGGESSTTGSGAFAVAFIKEYVVKIKDSVVFVTGANRGLGLAFAQALLARGARKVYAGARDPASVTLPGVVPVRIDVTDPSSIAAAAAQCADTTLLINNAGVARVMESTLDATFSDTAREIFETNFYGVVQTTQAFAPHLLANGGAAVVNVLSDASWFSRPLLAAYSATKAAAWSFTNALRVELREKGIQVLGLHVGFLDTDMTHGFDMVKTSPQHVAAVTLDALENGDEEVLADAGTQQVKQRLSSERADYLYPPEIV
jgi:NAD(P)-dependent dehydrogenase (short-subunit alcohol dehydrogenase family)